MNRFWTLILAAFLFSCSNHESKEPEPTIKNDTLTKSLEKEFHKTDSIVGLAVRYFQNEMGASISAKDYEIKYLRTGEKKYRKTGNLYLDSVHYWYQKLASVNK